MPGLSSQAGRAAPGEQEHLSTGQETPCPWWWLSSHLPGLPPTLTLESSRNGRLAASPGLGCTGEVQWPSHESQPGELVQPGLWLCGSVTDTCLLWAELCVTNTPEMHTNRNKPAWLFMYFTHFMCVHLYKSFTDTHMGHGGVKPSGSGICNVLGHKTNHSSSGGSRVNKS